MRLLDRAGELLSTEGAKALSLRKLASDAGTSTSAVYSLFGSKPDLVNALYAEGFRRFGERMRAVAMTDDPVEDFVRLGLAYRESAMADPHLYSIMFTKSVPGFEPSADAVAHSRRTMAPLTEIVERAIGSGRFADVDPGTIVISAWGIVHGLVSLELGGNLPPHLDVAASYEAALRAHAKGWLR